MQTKLHINLSQGIIDVEGDPELVKAVYEDFKERISGHTGSAPANVRQTALPAADISDNSNTKKTKRRSTSRKKTKTAESGDAGVNPEAPKLDKSVDTSKLRTFYDQFEPTNASEKILIFLKYLIEEAGIGKPNTDQVYTCFRSVNEKTPNAYAQAFRDAASKRGFIDFNSAVDIQITLMGENHFSHDLKRKSTE